MSRSAWQPLNQASGDKIEFGSLVVVARPDGKSWSGILNGKPKGGIVLKNANTLVELHYHLNPTASYQILTTPEWKIGFGQPRLPLG